MPRQKQIHESRPDGLHRNRVVKQCRCGVWYSLPVSVAHRHQSCSAACNAALREANKAARSRPCEECGSVFVPRPWQLSIEGWGKYCSSGCSMAAKRRCPGYLACGPKRVAAWKASGRRPPSGPNSPLWMGGNEASKRRRVESGKLAAGLRAYRAKNPERVRDWRHDRRARMAGYGRLPNGTVKNLRLLQRNKCAYCHVCLDGGYHVDHITPLARGGAHLPENLQLLCPPCNRRKSAIDPIEFAQRNGRLL